MTRELRVQHRDPACREKICLNDYETTFHYHEEVLFHRLQGQREQLSSAQLPLIQNFENFSRGIWGPATYAERVFVRVKPTFGADQVYNLEEIAVNGEIRYQDLKTLMDMGRVEVSVPGYFCGSAQGAMRGGLTVYLKDRDSFSEHDFRSLIRELDEVRPLHGEGMGNAFWLRCMDSPASEAQSPSVPTQAILEGLRISLSSPCNEDDIAYYDEDSGKAVCEESEVGMQPTAAGFQAALGGLTERMLITASGAAIRGSLSFTPGQMNALGAAFLNASLEKEEE